MGVRLLFSNKWKYISALLLSRIVQAKFLFAQKNILMGTSGTEETDLMTSLSNPLMSNETIGIWGCSLRLSSLQLFMAITFSTPFHHLGVVFTSLFAI
jgi:hypothetical protein